MGSKARAERRRHDRAQKQGMDTRVGITVAWCEDDEHLDEAKQRTHDGLIALMGDARSGGVTWRMYTGDGALNVIKQLVTTGDPEWGQKVASPVKRLLEQFGGTLVIASAPGRHPRSART